MSEVGRAMNRIRILALLLALCLLVTLLPASAFAEGEYGGGLVSLRFTAGGTARVMLLDAEGGPVLPLSDDGSYLLAPGNYSYYAVDVTSGDLLIPVTVLSLTGSEGSVEIPLGAASEAPAFLTQPEREQEAEPEEEPQEIMPMPVVFRCEQVIDFAGLTVTDPDGAVMQPWMDMLTGAILFDSYLLLPGAYSYWYHDPAGALPDQQGSFAVSADGMQTVELDLTGGTVGGCFSATAVNPYYADLISPDYIPTPSVSPEESLARLRVEVFSDPSQRLNGVFYAGTDGESVSGGSPVTYETPEAAGAALKRALIQRQEEISIRVKTHIKPTEQIWWDVCFMIYQEAIRHTGAPTEGDYLRYEYGGVTCNGSAAGSEETGEYYYQFIYSPLYFTTLAQEAELDSHIASILGSLQLSGKNDEQKIRALYQYLTEHVTFEQARDTLNFTAYSALVNGKAACQGFSVAFYRLCLELGVDARVVTSREMGHAWNIARADGSRYYALDATWDAGKGPEAWQYYLRGRENWKAEHSLGDEFADGRFSDYTFPDEDYGSASGTVINSISLLFDGLLRIKYYFVLPESLIAERGSSICFARGGEIFQQTALSEGKREGAYTCFYCAVNAEDIDTPVQARIQHADGSYEIISASNGKTYPNGFFFSPMEYARQMKTSASTAAMRSLAQALEDYGIAAQNYFKKRGDTLRDEVLSVSASDLDAWTIRAEGQRPEGFRDASASVVFEADNSLRVYLRFLNGYAPDSYRFQVDGQSARLSAKGDGTYYLSVENIAADALDTPHRFTVSDGTDSYTLTVSALGYCKTAIERGGEAMANLGKALYLYNRAAEKYFGA